MVVLPDRLSDLLPPCTGPFQPCRGEGSCGRAGGSTRFGYPVLPWNGTFWKWQTVLLSVTMLLGGALLCSAGSRIPILVSSPRLPHAWLLHHEGMGARGARLKLVLVDLQGKLFK